MPRQSLCPGTLHPQIDLSDDVVIGALFGDGSWQKGMQRLRAPSASGQPVDVTLDSNAFRNLTSILG